MSRARASGRPRDGSPPLLAASSAEEGRRTYGQVNSLGLVLELKRLGSHPLREIARLEHEAAAGESPTTPGILIVGIALVVWAFVALVIGAVVLVTHLIAG